MSDFIRASYYPNETVPSRVEIMTISKTAITALYKDKQASGETNHCVCVLGYGTVVVTPGSYKGIIEAVVD